jgi:hypothetical protein
MRSTSSAWSFGVAPALALAASLAAAAGGVSATGKAEPTGTAATATPTGTVLESFAGSDSSDVASGVLDEILLSPDPYYYESLGRRDPFVSLIGDDLGEGEMDISGPNSISVVGILWGEKDKFALVETADGMSAILRVGDRFRNTSVTAIRADSVVLYVTQYGIGRTLTLRLTEGKGSKNARGRQER